VPVYSQSRSRDNRLVRSLALQSQTEVGSKEFGGKLPRTEMDALDSAALLVWSLGEWTQESNVAKDEQPHSESSVSSLHVKSQCKMKSGRTTDHFGRGNNLSTDLP